MGRLRRYFISGLIVVVPVVLSIYVFTIGFKFIDGILGGFLNIYLKEIFGLYIPGLGFLFFIFVILLVGFLATRFFGKKLVHGLEKWFAGLPVIKNIYPAFKQVVLFISAQKEFGFKKVVLAEYPSKGMWSVGFLTNEQYKEVSNACGGEMVAVFIPSSPGPLTGYVIFLPKDSLKFPDISVSDALNIIISGGIFKPGQGA
jgi:uncharacterized membrane protein